MLVGAVNTWDVEVKMRGSVIYDEMFVVEWIKHWEVLCSCNVWIR